MANKTAETTRVVTLAEARTALKHAFTKTRPVMLWGPPGIGKSDIVRQVAEETGREVVDIRLTLYDPTDLKGFPYFDEKTKTMAWAPPMELPTDPKSNAIILLDELNSAAPSVQAAAYQLVLDRKIGTYKLPKGVDIIAAGNRDSDRGVTYRMPAPLANRFVHIELKTDYEDWLQWATLNKIHEQVVGYVGFAKQDLYDFDPKSSSRAFATPRSWSFVSELLQDDDLPEGTLTDLVAGAIGEGLAVKFMAHRKVAKQMPHPENILAGKVKKCDIKEISAMYSLTVSMCYELQSAYEKKVKDWDAMADNFFGFMMDNFPTELVVMGAKVALTNYQLPFDASKLNNFDKFHDKYGKFIITAMEG